MPQVVFVDVTNLSRSHISFPLEHISLSSLFFFTVYSYLSPSPHDIFLPSSLTSRNLHDIRPPLNTTFFTSTIDPPLAYYISLLPCVEFFISSLLLLALQNIKYFVTSSLKIRLNINSASKCNTSFQPFSNCFIGSSRLSLVIQSTGYS